MLDWQLYLGALMEELQSNLGERRAQIRGIELNHPRFRNIEYPLATTPILLRAKWEREHRVRVEAYLRLLEKVVEMCVQHAEISAYLGHSDVEREFILTPKFTGRYIEVCRLDGYVDRRSGNFRILEHNSDSPAGTLFTPRLNALIRQVNGRFGPRALYKALADSKFDDPRFTRRFFESFVRAGVRGMAVLQQHGKSNAESLEMQAAFSDEGLTTVVCDPEEVLLEKNRIRACGVPISVIWNKINSVYWRDYAAGHPHVVDKWLRLLHDHRLAHLNHFGARLVAENKRCLSLLQEEYFSHLFSEGEHRLIAELLPWATKCEAGKTVYWRGAEYGLEELATAQREAFVIKEPYDIRGDGVTIGLDSPDAHWRTKLQQAFGAGYVLQEYVPPLQLPIANVEHWDPVVVANVSLDTFVFGGRIAGYGAKGSQKHKVNLFKGGQKLAVFVRTPEPETISSASGVEKLYERG